MVVAEDRKASILTECSSFKNRLIIHSLGHNHYVGVASTQLKYSQPHDNANNFLARYQDPDSM